MSMVYRFDDFTLDASTFELRHRDQRLSTEPQVMELLLLLVQHHDRVVSKQEIFEQVWKGRVVSDSALSSRIKAARQLLGDDGTTQRYIRTVHRRGFRFVALLTADESEEALGADRRQRRLSGPSHPQTRYARSGTVHVAYHLFGDGPIDLVLAPGFVSHIDNYWDHPTLENWLTELGRIARVAMFDKRGTGLSDPVTDLPGMDERMDDVRAVMDAVGFKRAVIMGVSEGGSLAALFAATHPQRSLALVLYGAFARFSSWFPTEQSLQAFFDYVESGWGSGTSLPKFAPSMTEDREFQQWWGKFERLGATPGAVIALMRMNAKIDIADVLPTIRVPSLIIHRSKDVLVDVEGGRFLARHIAHSQYVELPGDDHLAWVGDNSRQILSEIEVFLRTLPTLAVTDRMLATVLVVHFEATGKTASQGGPINDLSDVAELVKHQLAPHRGKYIRAGGDGVVSTFDGPARALRCALAVLNDAASKNWTCRAGVHTGEVDVTVGDVTGIAVRIAVNLTRLADSGQILVSRTVKDLVAGSGIEFEQAGEHYLDGVDEPWQLYRVPS